MKDTQLTQSERAQIYAFNQLGDALCAPPPPLTEREKFLVLQAVRSIKADAQARLDAVTAEYAKINARVSEKPLTRDVIDLAERGAAMGAYKNTITTCEVYEVIYR